MNIIQRKRTKQEILDNINKASIVHGKMKKCICHANNIYWCRNMKLTPSFQEDDYLNNLNIAMPTLLTLIKEFKELYLINDKLCLDCPKMQEFSESYFNRTINSFYLEINTIKLNIKHLDDYASNRELKKAVKLLEIAAENVKKNLGDFLEQSVHQI